MKFIHSNGESFDLLQLHEIGVNNCTSIIASFPYGMEGAASDELFGLTKSLGKKITTYFRVDWSVPFDTRIIRNYAAPECTFFGIRDFLHAKVVWWQGWGVYIGSCNLTDRAVFENFEAGIFIDQLELDSSGIANSLTEFFCNLHAHREECKQPLLDLLDEQNIRLMQFRHHRHEMSEEFNARLFNLLHKTS